MKQTMEVPKLVERTEAGQRVSSKFTNYLNEIAPGFDTSQLDPLLQQQIEQNKSKLNNGLETIPMAFILAISTIIAYGTRGQVEKSYPILQTLGAYYGIIY